MKKFLTLAAVAVLTSVSFAAQVFPLSNGINEVNGCGEIAAIECYTVGSLQAVTANVINVVTEFTNKIDVVTTRHDKYSFTVTNYDGNASIATNVLDRFSYSDWFTTNGLYKIVGDVTHSFTNISKNVNGVLIPKATYSITNSVATGTANNHYLKLTPASTMYFTGGKFKIDCGNFDKVNLLLK